MIMITAADYGFLTLTLVEKSAGLRSTTTFTPAVAESSLWLTELVIVTVTLTAVRRPCLLDRISLARGHRPGHCFDYAARLTQNRLVGPSYACVSSPAGIMTEGVSSVASGSRMSKRRRVEECKTDEGNAHGPSDSYHDSWTDETPRQIAASQDAASYAAITTAFNNAAARPPINANESSRWQQSNPSAYPDLAAGFQQPYYYQQSGQATYNTAWTPTDSQAYGSATATTSSYTTGEPSGTATMPYFPPTTSGTAQLVEAIDALDGATAFNYPEVEHATQYAYNRNTSRSAANMTASRDVAKPGSAYYFDDASMHLKIQSLPILDNLATQLIHTISKASFPQIQDMMRVADSEDGQAYRTLKNLFDQTRKVYSRETAFIDAIAIQMFQPAQQEIIRKANIATFISSILGAHDVSFFHLNEFFMETFVPLGHRLLKWQGAIYLELKTQTYISALMNSDGGPEEMLDELFPPDLDAQILTRHPDAPSLSPSEQDFIDRSRARKSYLLAEPTSADALKELPKKYQWSDFVREFASCITKNVDGIMNVPARSQAVSTSAKGANAEISGQNGANGASNGTFAAVSNLSINGKASGSGGPEPRKPTPAASTIRQPWTKPEEDALLAGLERVNGPHWSQILALYGRGGSVSEVLKDRNQVQLKDKARNLKLWYLKTGKEVPPSLRGVTGELRKRGGARARAALGMTDENEDAGAAAEKDADGEDGEEADQDKETTTRSGRASKKKSKKT
ncbi:uncharacterized protein MYCFIDRAFT_208965 [Pseudocercospora fijiensis CIRAD86]|uniref:Myb-like domain-containing protein n=1 Tax=Pseudocercospora fijiensis (strain CIRAD86) TaxID=383855 RepID=M3AMS4_PSEFD|nr:uncharacterized protein MYCFIDRAFT_208965 [Pseudocercospora fijiensis CIRAD86]EME78428.1 hypothetical protein MYCFIDRAFT_208965 [Pseudocercospora fijiensis CIRAD86]